MTYLETYKKLAEVSERAEGNAMDHQVANFREQLAAGKINRPYLASLHDLLRRDLNLEVERPNGTFPQAAYRAARRYMAVHTILAIPEVAR